MKKTKMEKGITLVALIITIVVLLILAVVAIGAVQGDGIISKAKEAKDSYTIAQEKEEVQLAVLELQLVQNNEELTLESYLETKYGAENVQLNSDASITVTVPSGNRYVVTESGAATLLDGTVEEPTPVVPAIGDKVAYNEGSGKTSTVDSTFVMDDMEWRILDIEADGTIELISTKPTTSTLTLSEEEGWLNAEENLDKLCNDLYANGTGVTARSLKVEDIDKLAGITTDVDRKAINSSYGDKYQYQYSTSAGYIQSRFSTDDGSSWSDWTNITNSYWQTFTEPGYDAINSSNTSRVADLTLTFYSYSISSKVTRTTSDGISMASLISQGLNDSNVAASGTNVGQWLSSKAVNCRGAYATFGIQAVAGDVVDVRCYWESALYFYSHELALRPVIALPSSATLTRVGGVWQVTIVE